MCFASSRIKAKAIKLVSMRYFVHIWWLIRKKSDKINYLAPPFDLPDVDAGI
jgi:hypothetical protein